MFVHLIQFEVTDGLDLGLLDGGAHVTLGLSRSSRLWTRFFRGSGEDPVDTSGDLRSEPQWKVKRKKDKRFINERSHGHSTLSLERSFIQHTGHQPLDVMM